MSRSANPAIVSALQKIAEANNGLLRPEDVVSVAESESSPLHSWFEWDEGQAAHAWRLEQARHLLRVTVRLIGIGNEKKSVRVFVSLTTDQQEDGGGYRQLVVVMSDKALRKQLLKDALAEMERFQKKYQELKELAEVFAAMKHVKTKQTARRWKTAKFKIKGITPLVVHRFRAPKKLWKNKKLGVE